VSIAHVPEQDGATDSFLSVMVFPPTEPTRVSGYFVSDP
jgi:hypothetical protein